MRSLKISELNSLRLLKMCRYWLKMRMNSFELIFARMMALEKESMKNCSA